jgi:hypothetical protein
MTTTYSPRFCAECGGEFTREIIEAGGSEASTVTIRGHVIEIPGLYSCKGCAEAIRMGARQSGITLESARDYLDEYFGPAVTMMLMSADTGEKAAMAAERLNDTIEVQAVLEACIHYQDQPGGLDFIPECTGNCGHEAGHTPREMAHFN